MHRAFTANNKIPTSIRISLLALSNHDAMKGPFMQLEQPPACWIFLNNLTWTARSKITLYRHVFLLSLWRSVAIRTDHPCWHCVFTLHEMHTIMQMVLEVIKPCWETHLPLFPYALPVPSTPWLRENPWLWKAAKVGSCSRRASVIGDAPGKEKSKLRKRI